MTHHDVWQDGTYQGPTQEQRALRRRLLLMGCCLAVAFFGLGSAFGAGLGNSPASDPQPMATVTVTETAAP